MILPNALTTYRSSFHHHHQGRHCLHHNHHHHFIHFLLRMHWIQVSQNCNSYCNCAPYNWKHCHSITVSSFGINLCSCLRTKLLGKFCLQTQLGRFVNSLNPWVCEALINKKKYYPLLWYHSSVETDQTFKDICISYMQIFNVTVAAWQRLMLLK